MVQGDGGAGGSESIARTAAEVEAFLAERPTDPSRVTLRALTGDDQAEFLDLTRASVDLHHPWISIATTPQDFQAFLGRFDHETTQGLLVCVRDTEAIAGVINLNSIIRGRYQCGSLGYAAFAPTVGQGYLTEGLGLVLDYSFRWLRLHRLEANIQPGNHASRKLVHRLGFRNEGYSPEMLFIDGAWQGHERWAITSSMRGEAHWEPHPTLPAH